MSLSIVGQGKFRGEKLRLIRLINGWTMKETADKLNKSATFISMLEKGQSHPTFQTILDLSRIFGVNHTFFLNGNTLPSVSGSTFFRERVAVPKRNSESAESKNILIAYLDSLIWPKLELNTFQMPSYALINSEFKLIDFDKIDEIANNVRQQFKLGIGPISNVTLLIERLGIRVNFIDLSSDQIDALTGKIGNQYYISVNKKNRSSVRIRFNLAHELGHILLHSGYSESDVKNSSKKKRMEQEAQHFAGSLLMPEKGIALDMAQTNMQFLKELKKHWLVSLAALIYRGNEIGLISDRQFLFLNQTISRHGWRKKEPYDDSIPIEKTSYLNSAVKYLVKDKNAFIKNISIDSGISESRILNLLNLNIKSESKKNKESYLRIVR